LFCCFEVFDVVLIEFVGERTAVQQVLMVNDSQLVRKTRTEIGNWFGGSRTYESAGFHHRSA